MIECQKYLKDKDDDLSAAHIRNEEMGYQMSQLEELLAKEREEKENQLNSEQRYIAINLFIACLNKILKIP